MKDEKTEKPLAVAVIGGGVFLCTKKLYNLFTCCRSRMEGNVRKSHNARNVICGAGVILGTKTKRLPRDRYWKEMPMLGNVTPAV